MHLSQITRRVSLLAHFTDEAKSTELLTSEAGFHLALSKYRLSKIAGHSSCPPVVHIPQGATERKRDPVIQRDEY